MNSHQRISSTSTQVTGLSSVSDISSTNNIFKVMAELCNACVCMVNKYILARPSITWNNGCDCKPCNCEECTFRRNANNSIEVRLLYENKLNDKVAHIENKSFNDKPTKRTDLNSPLEDAFVKQKITTLNDQTNTGNNSLSKYQYSCLHVPEILPRFTSLHDEYDASYGRSCKYAYARHTRRQLIGKPIKQYYDFHTAIVTNNPLSIMRKSPGIYDPKGQETYFCSHCECKNPPKKAELERYLAESLKLNTMKSSVSSICHCAPCECLSCPIQGDASFTNSQESLKSVRITPKRKSWSDVHFQLPEVSKRCVKPCALTVSSITKISNMRCRDTCKKYKAGIDGLPMSCPCSKLESKYRNLPVREVLKNVYEYDNDLDRFVHARRSPSNYGYNTVVNHATNTEYHTANKSIATIEAPSQYNTESKVKNYEYTLKIELVTPKLDDSKKESTMRKINKVSKSKIKEHTQRVMDDIYKDISRNSTSCENFIVEPVKDTKTSKAVTSKKGAKVDEFIISCVTPVKHTISQSAGKISKTSKPELCLKNESIFYQNNACPISPEQPSGKTSLYSVKRYVNQVDVPTFDESVYGINVKDLRVQEPCVRRVSFHTVSLKWKLPKAVDEILGYEILVDGTSIEKIFNPKRCLAVISCLPLVRRLLITIRTITKNPKRGILPCATIGYRPRANKYIRI